ncbi:MAG: hypothetical protein ACREBR_02180, partial [bacterium]
MSSVQGSDTGNETFREEVQQNVQDMERNLRDLTTDLLSPLTRIRQTMPELEEPTRFNFEAFLVSIGVKRIDLTNLSAGGFTEVDDLSLVDNEAIETFDITPVSKSALRNYIIWRTANINQNDDLMELINVTKRDILRARDDNASTRTSNPGVTYRTTTDDSFENREGRDSILYDNLNRQSILMNENTRAVREMSIINARKQMKPFVETFKANTECPKFDGKEKNWHDFKRKFQAFLGSHGLSHLLKLPTTEGEVNFDPKYEEKNIWMYHILMSHVSRSALSYTRPQKDNFGQVVMNGQKLWVMICDWYEGETNKASMARMARAKLEMTVLKENGDIGTYLSSMNEQFQLLEDSGDLMSDRQQIEHICRNIKDKRYIMEC